MVAVQALSKSVAMSVRYLGGPRDRRVVVTEYYAQPPDIPEPLSRLEPGSLAASVMHSAAVVLAVHCRDEDGKCTRPACIHPCVIADYADRCQELARQSKDVRALLEADRWLATWILLHLNDRGAS